MVQEVYKALLDRTASYESLLAQPPVHGPSLWACHVDSSSALECHHVPGCCLLELESTLEARFLVWGPSEDGPGVAKLRKTLPTMGQCVLVLPENEYAGLGWCEMAPTFT